MEIAADGDGARDGSDVGFFEENGADDVADVMVSKNARARAMNV